MSAVTTTTSRWSRAVFNGGLLLFRGHRGQQGIPRGEMIDDPLSYMLAPTSSTHSVLGEVTPLYVNSWHAVSAGCHDMHCSQAMVNEAIHDLKEHV
jgi:hypothetical protein